MTAKREYQVALSFAGEQRGYVDEVARHLGMRSIDVFYDGYLQAWLWGRDGVETFHEVFAMKANYVVMFISVEYVEKPWTRVERRAAFSQMIKEEEEYVLPVRFDDTAVPGLPDTVQYLRANEHTPAELAGADCRETRGCSFCRKGIRCATAENDVSVLASQFSTTAISMVDTSSARGRRSLKRIGRKRVTGPSTSTTTRKSINGVALDPKCNLD